MMIGREKSCTCWVVVLSFTVCYTCAFEGGIPQVNAFHDHRFFLREIFDKYGDNGIITFEVSPDGAVRTIFSYLPIDFLCLF